MIGYLLAIAALVLLTSCQGVSAGPSTQATAALSLNSTSVDFGTVRVGTSKTVSATATNSGSAALTINSVAISSRYFAITAPTLPITIGAGQSTPISIKFTPDASGAFNASLSVASNASDAVPTISLTGTGSVTGTQLGVSPGTLSLGNVIVGSSGTGSGNLTASGGSVTVSSATSNSTSFTLSGISLPLTIAAGQSVPYSVTFSPPVAGSASATLTFSSNAQPSAIMESVTGTGTPAPTHSVNLSWSGSTSSSISGYNIYRALYSGACGSFSKINSLLNTGTLYTDPTVANGTSYCYAATTMSSSNVESGYSNIVSNIQIPAQ